MVVLHHWIAVEKDSFQGLILPDVTGMFVQHISCLFICFSFLFSAEPHDASSVDWCRHCHEEVPAGHSHFMKRELGISWWFGLLFCIAVGSFSFSCSCALLLGLLAVQPLSLMFLCASLSLLAVPPFTLFKHSLSLRWDLRCLFSCVVISFFCASLQDLHCLPAVQSSLSSVFFPYFSSLRPLPASISAPSPPPPPPNQHETFLCLGSFVTVHTHPKMFSLLLLFVVRHLCLASLVSHFFHRFVLFLLSVVIF